MEKSRDGAARYCPPSASVCFLGRRTHVRTEEARRKHGNYKGKQTKIPQIEEIGGRLDRYCTRQLPSASASFRDRLAAAVSLVSDIRLVEGVGKLEMGFLGNRKPKAADAP